MIKFLAAWLICWIVIHFSVSLVKCIYMEIKRRKQNKVIETQLLAETQPLTDLERIEAVQHFFAGLNGEFIFTPLGEDDQTDKDWEKNGF